MKTWPGAIAAATLIVVGFLGTIAGLWYAIDFYPVVVEWVLTALVIIYAVGLTAVILKHEWEKKNG